MEYCERKNPRNFGVDPTQNGGLATISDFCYNIMHMDHIQYEGPRRLANVDENK